MADNNIDSWLGKEVFTWDSVNSSGRLLEVSVLFSVVFSRS